MPNTCTQCGATLAPESTFCTACGTAVAAPVAVPPPSYTAPVAAPASMQPVKGGSSALKIILIVVGIFVVLGVLAVGVVGFIGWKVSRSVHLDKNGNGTMTIGDQTISTGPDTSISASDLGIDIYPGAAHAPGSMNIKSSEGSMTTASYTTTDSVSQVVQFYKSKLGENATTMETGGGTILTSANDNHKDSVVITVSAQDGKTKIGIVHSTKTN